MPIQRFRRWLPEDKEAMIQEIEGGATLKEVGEKRGITQQRVSQLIPKVSDIRGYVAKDAQSKVKELADAGISDQETAELTGLKLSTVKTYRVRVGVKYSPGKRRWSRETVLIKALEWYVRHNETPSSADWNPSFLKSRGYTKRLERFRESGAPTFSVAQSLFGSWSEMIRQSGLTPALRGGAARGRYKKQG